MLTLRTVNSVTGQIYFLDLCKCFTLLIVMLATLNILNILRIYVPLSTGIPASVDYINLFKAQWLLHVPLCIFQKFYILLTVYSCVVYAS